MEALKRTGCNHKGDVSFLMLMSNYEYIHGAHLKITLDADDSFQAEKGN